MKAYVAREFAAHGEAWRRTEAEIGDQVLTAGELLAGCLAGGGKLLLFGNGGSAADAQHLAAELVGRFQTERRGLPAIALTTDSSALTSIANDYGYERVFTRQIEALARAGDGILAISTSGHSANVNAAVRAAREVGCRVVGLCGKGGGALAARCDVAVVVPSTDTQRIQEMHILIGHILCGIIEQRLGT